MEKKSDKVAEDCTVIEKFLILVGTNCGMSDLSTIIRLTS